MSDDNGGVWGGLVTLGGILGVVWLIVWLCKFLTTLYEFVTAHWVVVSLALAGCCIVVGLIIWIYKTYIARSIGSFDVEIEEGELKALRKCDRRPYGSDGGIEGAGCYPMYEGRGSVSSAWSVASDAWSVASDFTEPRSPFSGCMAESTSFLGEQTKRGRKEDVVLVPNTSLVVIDGNNLVLSGEELGTENGKKLGVEILKAVLAALDEKEYRHVVFFDKSIFYRLREELHDQNGIDYIREGVKLGIFHIAPSKVEADGQILQLADKEGGSHVVSRDHFRDYERIYPWIKGSRNSCRVHGLNLVPTTGGVRILIAGFDLDIVVPMRKDVNK